MDKEIIEYLESVSQKVDTLTKVFNARIDNLKKVIGDYLELSSNISMATVKANLKSV